MTMNTLWLVPLHTAARRESPSWIMMGISLGFLVLGFVLPVFLRYLRKRSGNQPPPPGTQTYRPMENPMEQEEPEPEEVEDLLAPQEEEETKEPIFPPPERTVVPAQEMDCTPALSSTDVQAQLAELKALAAKGLVGPGDYEKKKSEILKNYLRK